MCPKALEVIAPARLKCEQVSLYNSVFHTLNLLSNILASSKLDAKSFALTESSIMIPAHPIHMNGAVGPATSSSHPPRGRMGMSNKNGRVIYKQKRPSHLSDDQAKKLKKKKSYNIVERLLETRTMKAASKNNGKSRSLPSWP